MVLKQDRNPCFTKVLFFLNKNSKLGISWAYIKLFTLYPNPRVLTLIQQNFWVLRKTCLSSSDTRLGVLYLTYSFKQLVRTVHDLKSSTYIKQTRVHNQNKTTRNRISKLFFWEPLHGHNGTKRFGSHSTTAFPLGGRQKVSRAPIFHTLASKLENAIGSFRLLGRNCNFRQWLLSHNSSAIFWFAHILTAAVSKGDGGSG